MSFGGLTLGGKRAQLFSITFDAKLCNNVYKVINAVRWDKAIDIERSVSYGKNPLHIKAVPKEHRLLLIPRWTSHLLTMAKECLIITKI